MPGIVDIRTILFILSLVTNIRSTKVLSDQKKCGDPECETSMSRVQAIKDYVGPDCRYLNFKTGEEIMVYFKLSRKREDLWAGSKGTDFGYFPMNAVQIEEVFITKEVEVPTKETDFLCLDGGEYTIENEENRLNLLDEGNENRYFYTNEKLKMPENEYKGIKEHEEVSPEKYEYDSKSEELHSLDITTHTDSEFKGSKTGQDETIILEEQSRQMLKPVPTQSTWTISGLADWLGLESVGDKEAASTTSEGTEEMTFRHRKIKITEDSDFEKLNEEVKTELNKEVKIEPKNSGWFRSTLKDLLNYGSEKTGLGVLYKENDPEVYDSSAVSGNIDDHTVSETSLEGDRDSEHRDSEPFESNWFELELRDVLAFGYSKENKVKEELSVKEKNNHDEEPSVPIPNAQSSLMDEEMGKQTDKTVTSGEENKEQYNKETSKEILGPASSEDEKYEQEENADLNEPATSFPADFADKSVKQDSKPRNQAMENINTKDMTKEPERTSDQSGWYESIGLSDNQPGHKSVKIKCQQESDADNLLPSHSKGKDFDPIVTQTIRDNNQEDPQKYKSFFSISYFTSILNFQGFIAKENINVEHAENELKSGEESSQSKKGHRIVEINKESKEQIRLNDNVIEKILQSSYVNTSEKNILMSSSTTNNNLEIRNKKQANESAQEQMPHNQPGRSKPKYRRASGQCIQLNWNCTLENLEIQGHSNPEEKQIGHILEVKPASLLDVGNLVNSSDNQHYTRKSIYSHEKSGLIKGKPYDGEIAMLDKSEKVNNSHLQGLGIYLDRTSEGGMFGRMNDTNERCPAIQKQFFSKDPKEYSDAFTQPRDFLSEDVVFLEVSDKDNPVIQEGGEELLLEKNHAKEDNKINKISTVQAGVNQHFSKDTSYLKANIFYSQEVEEDQGSQNAASFSFSSISRQDPLKDANSEEKSRQHESLGFQNFTVKNKNSLQLTQENKNISDGNSMSSGSVQLLLNNKEVKENNPSPQEKYKEATVKEDFSNKDIWLPLSGGQNNGDSENVGRDVNLLIDMPPSQSKEYLLEHTINSLFSKKKFKEKEIQNHEQVFTNARDDKQSFSGQQHEAPLLKFNLQRSSQPGKTINRESRSRSQNKCLVSSILNGKSYTPVSDYTDIMKKTRVSDPLSFL